MTEYNLELKTRAKQLHEVLKENFPGVKFSVRIKSHASGSQIVVHCPEAEVADDGLLSEAIKQCLLQNPSNSKRFLTESVGLFEYL